MARGTFQAYVSKDEDELNEENENWMENKTLSLRTELRVSFFPSLFHIKTSSYVSCCWREEENMTLYTSQSSD